MALFVGWGQLGECKHAWDRSGVGSWTGGRQWPVIWAKMGAAELRSGRKRPS